MADSTASIKSLYSGKSRISNENIDRLSGTSLVYSAGEDDKIIIGLSVATSKSQKPQEEFAASGVGDRRHERRHEMYKHHYTEEAQDLKYSSTSKSSPLGFVSPKWIANNQTSENESFASSFGELDLAIRSESEANISESDLSQSEESSRPFSRCSSTSGFSTTATKDGVEGRRPMRLMPRHYGKNKKEKPNCQNRVADSYVEKDNRPTNISLQSTTGSPSSSSRGVNYASVFKSELDAVALPPISLDEKIELMSKDGSRTDR